jgi:RND family efflux transporter MFP subunit
VGLALSVRAGYVAGVAAVAAVVSVALFVRSSGSGQIPVADVRRGEFVISVTRGGEVRAERSLTVTAPAVGEQIVITELIKEGTFVKKGDLLAQFDPTSLISRLESAEQDARAAQAEVDLASAQSDLKRRELLEEIRRKEIALKAAEGGSPISLEDARQELEIAKARYETELKIMSAETVKKQVTVSRAEQRVESAGRSLEQLSVKSPGDGLVIHEKVWRGGRQVKVQEGDSPWPMQPIISLPDLRTLYVATDVDETDISRIDTEQLCKVTLEAYPDTTFKGHVRTIGNLARSRYYDGGPNVFDVHVELGQMDPRFRPGMKAKVEIIVDALEDQVFVPIEAVFDNDGRTVVYAKRGRTFAAHEVEVGRRNDTHVVIHSGLDDVETLALTDPTRKAEE